MQTGFTSFATEHSGLSFNVDPRTVDMNHEVTSVWSGGKGAGEGQLPGLGACPLGYGFKACLEETQESRLVHHLQPPRLLAGVVYRLN